MYVDLRTKKTQDHMMDVSIWSFVKGFASTVGNLTLLIGVIAPCDNPPLNTMMTSLVLSGMRRILEQIDFPPPDL